MLSSLLTWLDASDAHYWWVAWTLFSLTVGVALVAFFSSRPPAWWLHPAVWSVLLLLPLLGFRWPSLYENKQLPDPDESQLMAGALTLRHDPLFWRSVDGTTHGPLATLPLVAPLLAGCALDFTTARTISILLAWSAVFGAWLVFRRLFGANAAGVLVLPLLATHAFTHAWYFVAYCSEHAPAALLAVGCVALLTAWDPSGHAPRRGRLLLAGVALGAVPFAKIQSAPIAAWAAIGGIGLLLATTGLAAPERRRAISVFVAGLAIIPVAILGSVIVCGLWSDFWQCYILDNLRYAGARWFSWAETPAKLIELGELSEGFNPFFLWSVGLAAGALLLLPKFARWQRHASLFALGLVLAGAYATMAPGRMFMHYIQLLIFPAGLMVGIVAGGAFAIADGRRPCFGLSPRSARLTLLMVFLGCGLLPQVRWRAREGQPFLGRFRADRGALHESTVAREILRHAQPGERLGIWGWMPTFWVETGMIQGTRDGNNARQIEPSTERDAYRRRYLADLLRTEPPIFVDAVGDDNFAYHDRAIAGHETFPELRDHIAAHYRLVNDLEGTRVYVRNDRR